MPVRLCVCGREKEGERDEVATHVGFFDDGCPCVCVFVFVSICVCVCVCVRVRVRVRMRVSE